MKRIFKGTLIVAAILVCMLLAACSGGSENGEGETGGAETAPTANTNDDTGDEYTPTGHYTGVVGEWINEELEIYIDLFDNGAYRIDFYEYLPDGMPTEGEYYQDDIGLVLMPWGSGSDYDLNNAVGTTTFVVEGEHDGKMIFDGIDGYFFKNSDIPVGDTPEASTEPLLEELGLSDRFGEIGNIYYLEEGVSFQKMDGSQYSTGEVENGIEMIGETDLGNGYKNVQFTGYFFIPYDSVPQISGEFIYTTQSPLMDYYTGYVFKRPRTFEGSDVGDNIYTQNIPFGGEIVEITVDHKVSYETHTAEYFAIAKSEFTVTMPVDYDGLVYCAAPLPATYADLEARHAEQDAYNESEEFIALTHFNYVDWESGVYYRIGE